MSGEGSKTRLSKRKWLMEHFEHLEAEAAFVRTNYDELKLVKTVVFQVAEQEEGRFPIAPA